ncbi:sensor histidine kinase [Glycomyces terrestris]|uniref:Signal transduction histidine kinase subgroup 3 dimerisation and phosphoacceptor domain-containing protein n=1 Tax=Glycomyces terrestris TaxID=2493553 RepID=A0A426V4G4_9ACTN|nr:histidine kinase [Glycomyces terrestris]RRS01708.1 hypothetical protein EIW28_02815 [Glycomyces terrestris]
MNAFANPSSAVRWAPRLMLAIHLPMLAQAPILVVTDGIREHSSPAKTTAVVLALFTTVLHLRHIRAAARCERPALMPLTAAVQLAAAYAGFWWFGPDWGSAQGPAMVSAMLLLPGVWRWTLGFGAPLAAGLVLYAYFGSREFGARVMALELVYYLVIMTVFVCALYGAVRLVPLVKELYRTRAALARAAAARERLRLSRDLHDLLGHSLSAIALKGDLALRLLPADPGAAAREAAGIGEVARTALLDLDEVTRDEHPTVLSNEVAAAAELLAAAGVETLSDVPDLDPPLAADAEVVLAWAVREGAVNLVRHARATTCSIELRREAGRAVLEIVNDGAASPAAVGGTGLAGLAARAAAVGGRTVVDTGHGLFRLRVEVPAERG